MTPERVGVRTVPSLLLRRFRILRPLGAGAEGRVYLAEDRTQGGGRLSLKILDRLPAKNLPELRLRLSALARIDHPNIARILDFDVSGDGRCLWIAREYVAGEDLSRFSTGDRESLPRLLEGVARALLQLHDRNLVHGDLRPANILCSRTPEGLMLKLIDGGVALPAAELAAGQLLHLRRQDLRSVGASFYSALTGRTADRRVEPRRWNPAIPRWVNRLILRLLVPYSAHGVGTAEQFLEEILRQSRAPARGRRLQLTLSKPPLVGRDREMAAIRERMDLASRQKHRPSVVLVSGDPGSGKTALLREAQVYARAKGIHFIPAHAPAGDGLPYEPILQISQAVTALHGWVDSIQRPRQSPGQLSAALARILARAAERRPCIVAIDDAQTIAPDAAGVLRRTIEALTSWGTPIMFLLSVRGAEGAGRWGEALASPFFLPLPLGELDPDASATIIRLSLGLPPEDALVRRLHSLTGGNPGLLLTSLELLRPRFRREGSAVGVSSLDALPVSQDAGAAAARAASSLDPAFLRAARTISAHPGFLKEAICLDVLNDPKGSDLMRSLVERGVLRRVSLHTYEWASTALRHEFYGRLPRDQRAGLHARFARAGRLWMPPGTLAAHLFQAYHLARTDRPERAVLPALDSARLLASVFRYGEAADYYELALRLLRPGRSSSSIAVLKSLQTACRKGGMHRRGKPVSLELLRRKPSLAQYAEAARFVRMVDGAPAAVDFVDRGLASRCRRSPRGLALLWAQRASWLALAGRTAQALRSGARAEVYLRECRDAGTSADVLMGLGSLHFLRGDLPRASGCFLDALGLTRKARDTVREAALCDNVSLAFRSQLQTAQALRYARRALAIKLRQGLLLEAALTRMVLGALLDDSGDHEAGKAELLRARETFRARGDGFRQAWATCGIASIHLALEQHPEAVEWFDRTIDEAPKDARNGLALAAHAGKIQVFLATGDLARAQETLRAGADHLHSGVGFEARLAWIRAQTLAAFHAGRGAAARIRLRDALRRLSRSDAKSSALQVRMIGLMLDLHLDGPSAEFTGKIDALISTLEATGLRPLLCESYLLGAEAAVLQGDVRRARFLLGRADPLLQFQPQPSFRIRRELLRSRLAASHAGRVSAALEAFRQATRHELRPLIRAAALHLGRTYEAREDYSSALKYYQEAGNDAGHRSA